MTEAFGDPSDPTILLIHGAGSTMLSWDDELCVRLAAAGRFVIRYDLRDLPTLDAYVRDAIAILDAHLVPRAGGVIIAHGDDREAMEALAASDPFVRGGVASVEVTQFEATRGAV